jgi:glutamine synthetase
MGEIPEMDIENVKALIKEKVIDNVTIAVIDPNGNLRGKRLPAEDFPSICDNGVGFSTLAFGLDYADDVVVDNEFANFSNGFPDMMLIPDISTFVVIPWDEKSALVLTDCFDMQGNPIDISPRGVLRKIVERAELREIYPVMSLEYEFYVLSEDISSMADKGYINLKNLYPSQGYFDVNRTWDAHFLKDIWRQMKACNISVDSFECEQGRGMFEMPLKHGTPLEVADAAIILKNGIKEICRRNNMTATFMAKLNGAEEGVSGHVHQSIWDKAHKTNLFFNPDNHDNLSQVAAQYVEGQLRTLREFTALFCPNYNSYKRLVPGWFTGNTTTWGIQNRSTTLRVINNTAGGCRVEHRTPGADANPYIALAACLAGGVYGIENKLNPRPIFTEGDPNKISREDNEIIPYNMEAVDLLDGSSIARDFFGDAFIDHYTTMKRWEINTALSKVSDWERERYLIRA